MYSRTNLSPGAIWRRQVVRRDQQCTLCTSTDSLHAHRIDPHGPMTLENGRCLCRKCLRREHERTRMPRARGRPQRKTLIAQINYLQRELAMVKGKTPPQEVVDPEDVRNVVPESDTEDGDVTVIGVDQAPMPEINGSSQSEPSPEQPAVDPEVEVRERQAEQERIQAERVAYYQALQEAKEKK